MKPESNTVRLGIDDLDWASELLTESFFNTPPVPQLFREPFRKKQATFFMRCICAYALLFGEAYTTPNREGVALWLLPGQTAMTPTRMHRAGMLSAPFRLGLKAFRRFINFAIYTDELHKQAAPMPHYYLFVLGVGPAARGAGIGGRLLREMLERIDREKMPAFLETQNRQNVSLYQKFGFAVAAQGRLPKLANLSNYAMLRKPRN